MSKGGKMFGMAGKCNERSTKEFRMKNVLLFSLLIMHGVTVFAMQENTMRVQAIRTKERMIIDGKLTEGVWRTAPVVSSFIQYQPSNGILSDYRTEVRIAYDDGALYVGAYLYDSSPDSITAMLCRRDADVSTDMFAVLLDTYHDKRTGFYFALSPSGTMFDGTIQNDGNTDGSWDGVWEGKAQIDENGWTAEFRIPFSQLRFQAGDSLVWGINFIRDIARRNERSQIILQPKNEPGFVSRFAQLTGLDGLTPSSRFEISPYVTARAEYTHPDAADPLHSASIYAPGVGGDLKLGMGSNMTLDATINPDFGQVEVDPAVVNLSDMETFFDEKRPFFIEGANIFSFGTGGSNSNWNFNWPSVQFFYSRRIGRAPQGSLPDYDYADVPSGTKILGAAKLSGKLGDNWSIGTIHAITRSEHARLTYQGVRSTIEVEPLSYYGIGRVQKEFNAGSSAVGFYASLVDRKFDEPALRSDVNSRAVVGGVDGYTFIGEDREWVLSSWVGGSRIEGTREHILEVQQNSCHYFQRPDARNIRIDSNATALNGYGIKFRLNREKGNVLWNSSIGILSPGFDINDVGFLSRGDVINWHTGTGYRFVDPTNYYQSLYFLFAVFGNYDYDGNHTTQGYFHTGEIQLKNYWDITYRVAYSPQTINTRLTRGGPVSLNPAGVETGLNAYTNSALPVVFSTWYSTYVSQAENYLDVSAEVRWKPRGNVLFSFGPEYTRDQVDAQWVGAFDDVQQTSTYGHRYVFASMDQTTMSAGIRLNWTFTPELSLQLYMQPLISSGKYRNFKELAKPGTYTFNEYVSSSITQTDGNYVIDPDGTGPAPVFSFSNPDFNFKSLRGNVVLRWEYAPGSVLYLVWTQNRSDDVLEDGEFHFRSSVNRLLTAPGDNIVMAKMTYYFAR